MDSLTIGYVSGMIAAAVAVAQFVVPNALALILVAALSDTHSAVTWSVVGRTLGSTHWPMALGSDLTASQSVARRVSMIAWLKPLVLLLIAISAIVTPMGLYETVVVSSDLTDAAFVYVQDRGALGLGTAPRIGLGMARACGSGIPKVCPGGLGSINTTRDDRWINSTTEGWDYRISSDLAQLYQSGLDNQQPSVSSFFDIESRLYNFEFNEDAGNATYLVDSFRPLGSFVLASTPFLPRLGPQEWLSRAMTVFGLSQSSNNASFFPASISINEKPLAVEGLIIDAPHARIGFRNHTAPVNARLGAEWEEDILFFEPETQCVNTNISLRMDKNRDWRIDKTSYLVDDGGFVNMDVESPWRAKMGEYLWYDGTQDDAQLYWRARSTAWSVNVIYSNFFNVTKPKDREAYINSTMGKLFLVNSTMIDSTLNQISLSKRYDYQLSDTIPSGIDYENGTAVQIDLERAKNRTTWTNPFNISTANFTYLGEYCQGVGSSLNGRANLTNILVKCGMIQGTAQPLDGGEKTLVPLPDTKWIQPFYSCASATKATIKTVRLRYNTTNNDPEPLNRLEIVDITDKIYARDSDKPLWGIEDANFTLFNIDPLWGLVNPAQANHINLSTVRADHLYLPAGKTFIWDEDSFEEDYIPAVTGPAKAWMRVYESTDGNVVSGGVDYSGANSIALYNKWDNLTRTAEGTAHMINLIWMDYAANGLTGSRGQLSTNRLPPNLAPPSGGSSSSSSTRFKKRAEANTPTPGSVSVHLYHRAIRYRWVYSVPAFLTALVIAAICLAALAVVLVGRASPTRVRHFLWNLSPGRIFASFLYPGASHADSETREWIQSVGATEITISRSLKPVATGGGGFGAAVTKNTTANDFAAVSTSYQRVAQEEPKEGGGGHGGMGMGMKNGGVTMHSRPAPFH